MFNLMLTTVSNLSRLIERLFTWYKSGYSRKSRLRQICCSSGDQILYWQHDHTDSFFGN